MTPTQAKSPEGLGLGCAATKRHGRKQRHKAGGYVSEETLESLRAHCWYRRITQNQFFVTLVEAEIKELKRSGQLTPSIIDSYRNKQGQKDN